MPIAFELDGYTVIADKGFAGAEFEALMRELRARFLRPDRADEQPRFGRLGGIRQWIESIIDTINGQLSLEQQGAHTMPGLITRREPRSAQHAEFGLRAYPGRRDPVLRGEAVLVIRRGR